MTRPRVRTLRDGQRVFPARWYLLECCDCGLQHRLEFRVIDGNVAFRAWRQPRKRRR